MSKLLKNLLIIALALALVFSFAACGKDDADVSSGAPSDPIQDYEDEWGEIPDDEEQDKVTESLWQDGFGSGSATLEDPDDVQTESENSSANNSSENSSTEDTSSEDKASTSSDLVGEITGNVDALY